MTMADAAAAIANAGLKPESTDSVSTAVVTRTAPGAGVQVGKDAVVHLYTQ